MNIQPYKPPVWTVIWPGFTFTRHHNFDTCYSEFLLGAKKDGREYAVSYRLSDLDMINWPEKGEELFRAARTQIEGWIINDGGPRTH